MATNDPLFPDQWWLMPGTGANLPAVWPDYRGRGVVLGIVDTGIDYANPDLTGRIVTGADYDAVDGDSDANAPGDATAGGLLGHGAAIVEIAAGGLNNRIGGAGVAPEVVIVPFRMGPRFGRTPEQEIALLQRQSQVDVSLNAWSYSEEFFRDDFAGPVFGAAGTAIAHATYAGRGGLGTVFVRSAGNGADAGDDVGAHNYQNNRYGITVGALGRDGRPQPESTPGAALLIAAPGNFTSDAAAVVAGAVALILEANPDLGWRDVQDILALTARGGTPGEAGWTVNASGAWNGGGQPFSRKVGFGTLDLPAAIQLAESWTARSTGYNEVVATAATGPRLAIPDNAPRGVTSTIVIDRPILLDRVEVTLDIPHARAGDLQVFLTSPAGTTVALYDRLGSGQAAGPIVFTTGANIFRGETAQGTWRLTVVDTAPGATGTLASWRLQASGDPAGPDTRYVFTDAYARLADDPGRTRLTDPGGIDTLDAASVAASVRLDLRPGQTSTIAGRTLTVAPGTTLENATAGRGNDMIFGNAFNNLLQGGPGDDVFDGGPGNDTLVGGAGFDVVNVTTPQINTVVTRSANGRVVVTNVDGVDVLDGIEAISFAGGPPVPIATLLAVAPAQTPGDDAVGGTPGPDTIDGGPGNDTIEGLDGSDLLIGGDGNDFLSGGAGEDTLQGGAGDDTLFGGLQFDVLDGGPGTDTVDVGHRLDSVVDLFQGVVTFPTATITGTETVVNVENIAATDGKDFLVGSVGDNLVLARAGTDFLFGGGGNDTLDGGPGTDAAAYTFTRAEYTVNDTGDLSATVAFKAGGADGMDTLRNMELVAFSDQIVQIEDPVAVSVGGLVVDEQFYLEQNPDVAAAVEAGAVASAATHFVNFGQFEGRDPTAFFDTKYYLTQNPDVAAGVGAGVMSAYEHFSFFGWAEGRDPSAFFDVSDYFAENPDVAAANLNPLGHYLQFGFAEGRTVEVADLGYFT